MTEKHFETILAVLAEKVDEQAREIGYLKWQANNFKERLEECERKEK